MDTTKTASGTSLRTGCSVPESGIYRVSHSQHVLPKEVALLKGHAFPRCSRCRKPVSYELVCAAPSLANVPTNTLKVTLYEELPVSTDEEAAS
jgi:hypothetical protein